MTPTTFRQLTPSGSAAIAVLALAGPLVPNVLHQFFRRRNGRPLREPLAMGFAFGTFGHGAADEVVVRVHRPTQIEIHAHGGHQVVAWLKALLHEVGCVEGMPAADDPWELLAQARTVRTASILLDQAQGAFEQARRAVAAGDETVRRTLARMANVGRHLLEPWRIALAGRPNAGKSSLMNALAGFPRSIVSPIPGTTRDAVRLPLAFDGWPVDVIDTAGLRTTSDELEREGIARTRSALASCDLCIWLADATEEQPTADVLAREWNVPVARLLCVANKVDLVQQRPNGQAISAITGEGLEELVATIVQRLVPHVPQPGDPVPYTPALADLFTEDDL